MATALRLATRSSPLALVQARRVAALVEAVEGVPPEIVPLDSRGDRDVSVPIEAFAERGVFVTEIEQAVLDGRADAAVHSAKDLPSAAAPPGLLLAAVPERADPRDALVGACLDELGPGALVATGSVRRRAQLASFRPDLGFTGLRGNIGTRLARVPAGGAVLVAVAALERLGCLGQAAEILPTWLMLPQIGQGAIAVRCRAGDAAITERLSAIDHDPSRRALLAERAFLARLGGGCDAPVGALARLTPSGVVIDGLIASPDGRIVLRRRTAGSEAEATGTRLADELLADGVAAFADELAPGR
ncbi:MAG: hydroxymethylbilane synthase [Actinomycetota bacterium]|nr:hydroxymethylbilane synthase [Actinomycetota bacterium]